MNKSTKKIVVLFLALIVLVGLAPRFIQLETLQSEIVLRLKQELNTELIVDDIRWDWLPIPHLVLSKVQADNNQLKLAAQEINLYPHWRVLTGDLTRLGKILLKEPDIRIMALKNKGQGRGASFPHAKVVIENGKISMAGWNVIPGLIKTSDLNFSSVQSTITVKQENVILNFTGATPFSRTLHVLGDFNIKDKSYQFKINAQGLKLYDSLLDKIEEGIKPVLPEGAEISLIGSIQGKGLTEVTANFKGQIPCFVVKPRNNKLLLDCGIADFSLQKSGDDLVLDIRELEIKNPGLRLQGHIERHADKNLQDPSWRINLGARDLNLSAIREGVLTLWPDDPTAVTVCSIVLGGEAKTADFKFDGPLSRLAHLAAMEITVDVDSAHILVPHVGLDLTQANGKIKIINDTLSGHGLKATLGNSRGSNADLLLNLKKGEHDFRLDIDLDVDLAALPEVLHRLVKHQGFNDELTKLNNVKGRATGHLRLGDDLHNLTTEIQVATVEAEANYNRLAGHLKINSGQLDILPKKLRWQGLNGVIGPHIIHESNGSVDWTGPTNVDITQLDATIDSTALYTELKDNSALPSQIAETISAITGPLTIKNTVLQGRISRPEEWKYHLDLSTNNLECKSALIPDPVIFKTINSVIAHDKIIIHQCQTSLTNHPLAIKGELTHHLLKNWQGHLDLNGTIHAGLTGWIKARGWLPTGLTPHLPATLRDLNISWHSGTTEINGLILAGKGEEGAPVLGLDIYAAPEQFLIRKLSTTNQAQQGRLSLDLPRNGLPKSFTWTGTVSAETVNAFFTSKLRSGSLNGTLAGKISPDSNSFTGHAEAHDIIWAEQPDDSPIILNNLLIDGLNNHLAIKNIRLTRGPEAASAQGLMSFNKSGIILKLELESQLLSAGTITRLLDEFKTADQKKSSWKIFGDINFNINKFTIKKNLLQGKDTKEGITYAFTPLQGTMKTHPKDGIAATIDSANICGMDMTGIWRSNKELPQGYEIKSSPDSPPLLFQEILPCLGIKQDVINGEFSIHANPQYRQGKWTEGRAEIHSSQGAILRMNLLAKIFKVINITDLFSTNEDSSQKIKGFAYSDMDLETHIEKNRLHIDRMVIKGEGLNLFGRGNINLADFDADLTILVAPLKTIDKIISKVPLIGKIIGGKNATLVTIPVSVKGNISNPKITPLSPEALGDAFINFVTETLTIPFAILAPEPQQKEK